MDHLHSFLQPSHVTLSFRYSFTSFLKLSFRSCPSFPSPFSFFLIFKIHDSFSLSRVPILRQRVREREKGKDINSLFQVSTCVLFHPNNQTFIKLYGLDRKSG